MSVESDTSENLYLIGAIKTATDEVVGQLDLTIREPIERVESLRDGLKEHYHSLKTGPGKSNIGLLTNAINDMWLLSSGGFDLLLDDANNGHLLDDDPLETIKLSTESLSAPAYLPNSCWDKLRQQWVGNNHENSHLPTKLLELRNDEDERQIVGFSLASLIDIDSYVNDSGNRGCPARGIILNNVFERFIDGIFRESTIVKAIQEQ